MENKKLTELSIDNYLRNHYIHRSNWLRAGVLGANDGIISIASIAIGVVTASAGRTPVLLTTVAGIVAGALSMAAGEYVSVSSQTDTEQADIAREQQELIDMPSEELELLTQIYQQRGLTRSTAVQVAKELTAYDALGAHVRDELGITDISKANPLLAAIASGAAFIAGGVLPLLVVLLAPLETMAYWLYFATIVSLITLGTVTANIGGSPVGKAILRIAIWGTVAMGISALVGYCFGIKM